MCFFEHFEHFEQTDTEALLKEKINLDVLQCALEARIRRSTSLTEKALKQAQEWLNPITLAAVDREIDLLQSMRVDAECLKNLGRTDSYVRLDSILDDFTSMRATLAKTMALLLSANLPLEPAIAVKANLQRAFLGRLINAGGRVQTKKSGQRIITVIIYLNDVKAGGATVLPDINLSVYPQKGSALYFSYVNSKRQVDPSTLHGGSPVVEGEKWIATKWIREHVYA